MGADSMTPAWPTLQCPSSSWRRITIIHALALPPMSIASPAARRGYHQPGGLPHRARRGHDLAAAVPRRPARRATACVCGLGGRGGAAAAAAASSAGSAGAGHSDWAAATAAAAAAATAAAAVFASGSHAADGAGGHTVSATAVVRARCGVSPLGGARDLYIYINIRKNRTLTGVYVYFF